MRLTPIRLGVVDSTNERALVAIAAGSARHGDVFVASGQTEGRGRRGNVWQSAEDEGLFLSVVLLPEPRPGLQIHPAALTMAAGLGVLEGLAGFGIDELLRLKWPNDVFVDQAKLAGILVEARGYSSDEPHFVVGVGVNVAQREFPASLAEERSVTSLALEGSNTSPAEVLERLLPCLGLRLEQAMQDPEAVAADYLSELGLEGQAVRVTTGKTELTDRLLGLSIGQGLRLEGFSGRADTVPLEHVTGLERAWPGPGGLYSSAFIRPPESP